MGSFRKARGRCDDLVIGGRTKNALWVDAAHGGTGRIRWSRTLLGTRPAGTPPQLRRGAQVVCR